MPHSREIRNENKLKNGVPIVIPGRNLSLIKNIKAQKTEL